jgi:DNA-binding transcriptional ArsR family regulator
MLDILQSDYCAQMLRLLGDPERLLIIQALREDPKNVGDLAAATKQKIANVSHHLKVLREARIVEAERDGRFVRYRLAPDLLVPSKTGAVEFLDIGCCRLEIPKPKQSR